MADLFIPAKIRVGWQTREGTYENKLAYVIYYDNKGVLRKEKSWNGWRDQKIDPQDFNNTPQDGFVLNKGITRFNWSHFGSNRSMIRIYDPRGIEFEITPENLVGVLMETTCAKRGIEGKCVYAWAGTELVLLPCASEEYQKAVQYTARQDMKIVAKDMKPGCSYTTKKGEEVIFIGRYKWYTWNRYYSGEARTCKKAYIFAYPQKPQYRLKFFPKNDVSFLAVLNNPDPVSNFADLMDEFSGDIHSSSITGWVSSPVERKIHKVPRPHPYSDICELKRYNYAEPQGDDFHFWYLEIVYGYNNEKKSVLNGYRLISRGVFETKTLKRVSEIHSSWNYRQQSPILTEQQVLDRMLNFVDVFIVLESGKKVPLKDLNDCGD